MKKKMLILLTALLVACAAMALAEGSYVDLKARDLVLNRNSDNLGCRFEDAKYYCLIQPDGTKITGEIYNSMYGVSDYPFFKVEADSRDGIHDEGIIDDQGNVIVPVVYADVNVVSDRWAYGVKLTSSSADDKDYTFTNFSTGDKSFFRIDTVDFYYRGKLVGTLSRSDFDGYPTAYGDYICVPTREKTRVYYNASFEKSPYQAEYSGEYTSNYKNRATHYIHNGTGQPAFEEGCTLTEKEVKKSIVYENGRFLNLRGEEPFKAAQNYDSVRDFSGGYAVVRMNQKSGLIDQTGKEIIPVEYDEVGDYEDRPLEFGAIKAVKDGKFGYLDAAGNVTCDFVYANDIVRCYGALATVKNLDGTTIVLSGLVGELPEHYADVDMSYYGRAFVAENGQDECALIDVTGEVLIPYAETRSIYVNRAATVAFYSLGNRTYRVYTFTHDATAPKAAAAETAADEAAAAEAAETAGDGTWTCSNGHAGNTGKFCPECGEQKPADEIICPSCGTHYDPATAPNFCPEDGTKLK